MCLVGYIIALRRKGVGEGGRNVSKDNPVV